MQARLQFNCEIFVADLRDAIGLRRDSFSTCEVKKLGTFSSLIRWEIPRLCRGGSRGLTGLGISKSWALIVSNGPLPPLPSPLGKREEGRRGDRVRGFFLAVAVRPV